MSPRTICLNTKNNTSIALSMLTPFTYLKESFDGENAFGTLQKEKRITLPINRDGIEFTTVEDLFHYLTTKDRYVEI